MSTAEELSYGKIIEEINQYVGQSKMAWPRVRDVWSKLGPFLNSTMARHGCPPNFNHEINNILSILNYPPEDKEGPFCSKVVDSCKASDMQTSLARTAPQKTKVQPVSVSNASTLKSIQATTSDWFRNAMRCVTVVTRCRLTRKASAASMRRGGSRS
jgi:hypothetical protein